MASQDWFEKDFYAVLGVPPDSTQDVIKKAYRKLARQYHPDANSGNPTAEQRFKEIGEANSVLSDPEQRQQYDAVRAMSRGGARFTAGGPNGAGGGFEDLLGGLFGGGTPRGNVRFTTPGGASTGGFEDLLGGLFGNVGGPGAGPGAGPAGGPGFRVPRGPRRGEDISTDVTLSFRQAVEGAQLSVRVPGTRSGETRTVNARVPAGVRDGQKVRLRGKGRPGEQGGQDGDLVVAVHVEPHPVFGLDGSDLRITLPVTFAEAALGAQLAVPTFDGGTVRVKVPAGTPSGRTLRVKGRGVATAKGSGDLLVTVQVIVPQRLDGAARAAVEQFAAATSGDDPRAELMARARRDPTGAGDGSR
ncbi:MAG: molecular chaperone DnaJ [Actinomycetota bacterium]|nr:molecular chaperone DnaJ [Actinomycetota bacterium]